MSERKPFSEAYHEARAEGRERGCSVNVQFSFRRHEEPGKTPEGLSADFLTERGVERAREHGTRLAVGPEDYVMVVGSKAVNRARETGGYMLGIFRDDEGAAAIINKELGPEVQEQMGHGKMPPGDIVIYRSGDLDPVPGFAAIVKEAKVEGCADIKSQIQWWLDHPERAAALGVPTSREVAGNLAHRLLIGENMSAKLYEDTNVRVENLTHGPNAEALLREVMLREGKQGFDKLEEIGGMLEPGENVDFGIKRDANGELVIQGNLRGHKFSIDEERLRELQDEYMERQKARGPARKV